MRKTFDASGFECVITAEQYTVTLPPSRHHDMDGIGNGENRVVYRHRVIGTVAGKEVYKADDLITDTSVLNAVKVCEEQLKKTAKGNKEAKSLPTLKDKLKKLGFE